MSPPPQSIVIVSWSGRTLPLGHLAVVWSVGDVNDIPNIIEEPFTSQFCFMNCIDFSNTVLKNPKKDIGEQVLYYNLNKYK